MTDKWRWIFLLWHSWRAAVWRAEMCLYPEEHVGNLIRRPVRRAYAESMYDFHEGNRRELQRALFPPPPFDWDEFTRRQLRK